MVMHGAFDPRFPVPTGDTMLVGGPLQWDGDTHTDPARKIRIDSVRITQGGVQAGAEPNTHWNRPDEDEENTLGLDHWPANIQVEPGAFVAGAATAHVDAHVKRMDGTEVAEQWDHPIVLGT